MEAWPREITFYLNELSVRQDKYLKIKHLLFSPCELPFSLGFIFLWGPSMHIIKFVFLRGSFLC